MKKLPTYKITLSPDEKTPVYAVSLVDQPAIEVDWIKLSQEIQMQFSANQDKQMLFGPLLIPGKLIYRVDEATGQEYNIVFEKETIEEIVHRYNKSKVNDIFNINHSGTQVEAYLAENWLTKKPDSSEAYGFDLPEGTWFGGVKVEDQKFWMNEVKSDNVKGFSVEIKCGIELLELSKVSSPEEDKYNEQQNKLNLMEVKTKDGKVLMVDGELVAGSIVTLDGAPAPAGEHELEDGSIVVLDENGAILEIKAAQEMSADDKSTDNTEPTKLALDPAEVLTAIQPALDEFRAILAELSTRIDVLEQHEVEMPEMEDFNKEVKELKAQVEKLASAPGATSITNKNDAKEKNEERLLSKINFFSKINK